MNILMAIQTLHELFFKRLLYLAGLCVLEILCWRYMNCCVFRFLKKGRGANRADTAVDFNHNTIPAQRAECFVVLCTDLISVTMKETETERGREDM